MSSKIYLVRHGETEWNKQGIVQGQSESVLTELGKQQAQELKQKLSGIEFCAIYCSTLSRALETASIVADGQAITQMSELMEIHVGPMEGLPRAEAQEKYKDQFRNFWERPDLFELEGAETFFTLQQRSLRVIEKIAGASSGNVLVVSHGALIQTLHAYYNKIDMRFLWDNGPMENCSYKVFTF